MGKEVRTPSRLGDILNTVLWLIDSEILSVTDFPAPVSSLKCVFIRIVVQWPRINMIIRSCLPLSTAGSSVWNCSTPKKFYHKELHIEAILQAFIGKEQKALTCTQCVGFGVQAYMRMLSIWSPVGRQASACDWLILALLGACLEHTGSFETHTGF